MVSNTQITLNLQYPNIARVVYAMQGDRLSRSVVASLVDGDTPWTPPTGATGLITGEKPDGAIVVYDTLEDGSAAVVINGSTATFYLAEQLLTAAGRAKLTLSFFNGAGSRLTAFRITLVIAPQVVLDNVISGNYISVFTATLAEAQQMFEQIKAGYGAPLTASTSAAMTDTNRVYVYIGTTSGSLTNGHWYYWDGSAWADGGNYNSTGFTTDTTLTIAGAAADAKATGDVVGDLKSALAAKTQNLFDKTTITIGVNAAGAAASNNRALSGAIKVSGTAVYFAKTLPTNIKYEIQRYSGAEASTHTGAVSGGWNTTTTWRQYINSETYIRVLFGTVDNTAFSVHDFDELELCVLDAPILSDYIPHLTATDYLARKSIKAMGNDVSEIAELSRNLFDKEEVQIGVDESGTPNVSRAIGGAMHVGNLNSAVQAYNIDGLQYTIAFYSSDDISDYEAIRGEGSFIADTLSHLQTQVDYPYPYARIVLRRRDDAKINQSDLDNLVLQFETGNGSSDYIPYHTAYDYIARKDRETLTVCTWNVGLWNNGVTPYMDLTNLYKWYRLIGEAKADLLLTQESPIQLDESNTLSYNSFLGLLYPYIFSPKSGDSNYTAKGVASKMHQSNTTRNFFEDGVRTYLKSYITVGGKLVCLINAHLDFDQTRRTAEIGELLGVMNAEERVIVCGDFNVTALSEYDGFTSAGYRLANLGIFGKFDTCPNAAPIKAIDNIIVSNNIIITNVRVVDGAGSDGLSDHNPLLATLEI